MSGLAESDPEIGAALVPLMPPIDYLVRGPKGSIIDKKKLKAWREKVAQYQEDLNDYNSARAFDKQIERQKKTFAKTSVAPRPTTMWTC
ncbi:MAG: hypothetical protein IPK82_23825 [Polyangiaceae bacterium]|nr:hypothetical protein [Polyangiaceae bacterium]